jgi:hypothetical protein
MRLDIRVESPVPDAHWVMDVTIDAGHLHHQFVMGLAPTSVYNAGVFTPVATVPGRLRLGLYNGGGVGHCRWQWYTSWKGSAVAYALKNMRLPAKARTA